MARGSGFSVANANNLLFGKKSKSLVEPKLTREELIELEFQKEKADWEAKGGEVSRQANGDISWRMGNMQHRDEDKPAVEYVNGDKEWWFNGKLHRDEDKPAIDYTSGHKAWWVNGQQHRDKDKPAIEHSNGSKEWWIKGQLRRDNGKSPLEYTGLGIKSDGSEGF